MADHGIRRGSLQFYPRKKAKKVLHRVNWNGFEIGKGFGGFICYKVGMVSVYAKDLTEDSMNKNKRVVVPATILECPKMKIFSIRFYKDGKAAKDVIVDNNKILKKKVKIPKQVKDLGKAAKELEFDDLRVIVYSNVSETGLKKTSDFIEIGLAGSKEEKLNFVKEKIGKEISVADVFGEIKLVDVRGVTKSYGTQGPVKRFGISLKVKKSEKGRRRPGSLAPWHPSRVTFRAPQAGQTGGFSRISYNNFILKIGNIKEKNINKKSGFHKYGNIKTDYVILTGSVPGVKKRALVITPAMRATKKKAKLNFEVLELR